MIQDPQKTINSFYFHKEVKNQKQNPPQGLIIIYIKLLLEILMNKYF